MANGRHNLARREVAAAVVVSADDQKMTTHAGLARSVSKGISVDPRLRVGFLQNEWYATQSRRQTNEEIA
jgi:hypothetical protein